VAADSDSPLDSVYEWGQPQRQPQKPSNSKSLAKTVLAKPSTADSRLINRGKINNANGNLSLLSGPQANGQWTVDTGWRTLDIGRRTTMMRKIAIPILLVVAETAAGSALEKSSS